MFSDLVGGMKKDDPRQEAVSMIVGKSAVEVEALLVETLASTAKGVYVIAMAICFLESKGVDISRYRISTETLNRYRSVAIGRMSALVFLGFPAGDQRGKAIETLPLPQQDVVMERGSLTVSTPEGPVDVPLSELSATQAKRAIQGGRLLPVEEQEQEAPKAPRPKCYWDEADDSLHVTRICAVSRDEINEQMMLKKSGWIVTADDPNDYAMAARIAEQRGSDINTEILKAMREYGLLRKNKE